MGYEIHFVPSEKKMEEYKPWGFDKPSYESAETRVESARLQLLTYCLMGHKEDGCYKIEHQIKFLLNLLKAAIEQNEREVAYKRWLNDKDHELWYCGWEFAHESRMDMELTILRATEDLVILTYVVETPNYFKENNGFADKYKTLTERISDFIDMVSEYYIHQIINDLDEFKKKYDDEEGEDEPLKEGTLEQAQEPLFHGMTMKELKDHILQTKDLKVVENDNEEKEAYD